MIRPATAADLPVVRELWNEFELEVPDARWRDDDSAEDLAAVESCVDDGVLLLAEDGDRALGFVSAKRSGSRVAYAHVLYVRHDARGAGIAAELMRALAAQLAGDGIEMLELDVLASNGGARAVYDRWGFEPVELRLASPVADLSGRLVPPSGPTFGSVHVQTDDLGAVERAVAKVLPRLGRSAGTTVTGPRNGWVAVHDELCDREPTLLHRLGKELSYALPAVTLAIGVEEGVAVRYNLFDRGGAVDEYLSVPEYRGPLPPGDVVALGSNPRVVARLTGADPHQVREVARTAAKAEELPPAIELVGQIAAVMGVTEADHGWRGD